MANMITLSRIPLLILVVSFLYQPSPTLRFMAVGLIVLIYLTDMVDGLVARRRHESSLLGSVLDIAADRAVEVVLWIVFASLNRIPVAVPLIVVLRDVFVDALRSVAPARGLTPFELMRSDLGRFLVQSPWLRTPYALAKAAAFCLLSVQYGLSALGSPAAAALNSVAQSFTWIAVILCVLRGLPVLVEGPRALASGTPLADRSAMS
jgi:CDP-diacylglycerol---glycerol-3-phosphate 3-phosphatidyltransferase